jgi:hypothetical protein
MVAMPVNGPLREYDVGIFRGQGACERLVVFVIDDGTAIVLSGEDGAGLENLTRLARFGGPDGAALIERR